MFGRNWMKQLRGNLVCDTQAACNRAIEISLQTDQERSNRDIRSSRHRVLIFNQITSFK